MRLAFLVVYLAREPSRAVFKRHLEYVERYAPRCEWWIEAVAHRADEDARAVLRSKPFVRLHDTSSIPPVERTGSAEHAAYLDELMARAIAGGATHICTLDDDSFPVREDWLQVVLGHLSAGHAFVAPLRTENGDTDLPHPSFLFTSADFIRQEQPVFFPTRPADYQSYRRRQPQQQKDTGIGFAIAAHRSGRSWAQLLRTNRRNDHPIMAGIYGDVVFHFGAANRGKVFRLDRRDAQGDNDPKAVSTAAHARNQPVHRAALRRVSINMDAYLAHLRGFPAARHPAVPAASAQNKHADPVPYILYGDIGSGSSIVEMTLAKAGARVELREVPLSGHAQLDDDYRRINPMGRLPTLLLPDGTVMTETLAILPLLADRYPDAGLLPPPASADRAHVLRWMMLAGAEGYPHVTRADYPERFSADATHAEAIRARAKEMYRDLWRLVEKEAGLTGDPTAPFLLGRRFTVADIYLAVLSRWLDGVAWLPAACPKLATLGRAVAGRPRIAAVWKRHFPD